MRMLYHKAVNESQENLQPFIRGQDHCYTVTLMALDVSGYTTDLFIIGGGINGSGIAADAAGRGLSVLLCEKNDLANGASSASTKLIHGGLRYLEHFEFRLVRKSLKEREILLRKAPHIIRPMRFILPYEKHLRSIWMIRLGLFLYDYLGGRKQLQASKTIQLKQHLAGKVLNDNFKTAFVYSDCCVDDARLVVLNALAAKEKGAQILTRTACIRLQRQQNRWEALIKNTQTGRIESVQAKVLINAGGPWVDEILHDKIGISSEHHLKLVKGSHIVVPKFYDGEEAYALQHSDKRVVFVIPYEGQFSLIGTTEELFTDDPNKANIDLNETEYLFSIVKRYFKNPPAIKDIIWTYSGVRPLLYDEADNPSVITRDYKLELNGGGNTPPLLSVFGGKITTYRKLAEEVLRLLKPYLPKHKSKWTANTPLPGGDISHANFESFYQIFSQEYSWLPENLRYRYARCYGTLAYRFLKDAKKMSDLGKDFSGNLYQCEVDYLVNHEWALTVEDILWRRTKLGLIFPKDKLCKLEQYLKKPIDIYPL